jgi:hypothetical protein
MVVCNGKGVGNTCWHPTHWEEERAGWCHRNPDPDFKKNHLDPDPEKMNPDPKHCNEMYMKF